MNLSDFCRRITGPDTRLLPENHKLGARLVCPEYSKSVQEVKTYPLLGQDRSFLLCWNFDSPGNLYATMMPSPENFCYHYSYSEGNIHSFTRMIIWNFPMLWKENFTNGY